MYHRIYKRNSYSTNLINSGASLITFFFPKGTFIWRAILIDFWKSSQGYAYLIGYYYLIGKSMLPIICLELAWLALFFRDGHGVGDSKPYMKRRTKNSSTRFDSLCGDYLIGIYFST